MSYPQYSRYESGEQLPPLRQALLLCRELGIGAGKGLSAWALAQLRAGDEDAEARELSREIREIEELRSRASSSKSAQTSEGEAPARSLSLPLDDVFIFNRAHLKLFRSDALYRDVFSYVNSFSPEWITPTEVARDLSITPAKAERLLARLALGGVLVQAGGKYRPAKANFYFPDDADFFEMRNDNLLRNTAAILKTLKHDDISRQRAYRGLVTRELTEPQLATVASSLERILMDVVDLPEEPGAAQKVYSLCMLLGERYSRELSRSARADS